jgi:hypothetical protein
VGDAEKVVEMVLVQASARLEGQFRDNDALDVKTLGLLGANVAVLGLLIATHSSLGHLWWLPALSLGVSGVLQVVAVFPRKLDSGPSWRWIYETYGGGAPLEVGRVMLAEILAAIDRNDASSRKPHGKNFLFKIGFAALIIGMIGAGVAGYVR